MAKFKDKTTGVVLEFLLEHDIVGLRVHPEYDEVFDEVDNIKEEVKKAGRPKKESE